MRLYLKFMAVLALFTLTAALMTPAWKAVVEAGADVRIALISRFGSAADVEDLIEDIQRDRARQCGELEFHTKAKRYQRLLNDRVAEAAVGRDRPIEDDEYCRIQADCAREVLGGTEESLWP